jgi:hypothetical protein
VNTPEHVDLDLDLDLELDLFFAEFRSKPSPNVEIATFRRNILNTITQPYIICIAQNNYAPFTKNRREIVTIQKKYGVGGHLI